MERLWCDTKWEKRHSSFINVYTQWVVAGALWSFLIWRRIIFFFSLQIGRFEVFFLYSQLPIETKYYYYTLSWLTFFSHFLSFVRLCFCQGDHVGWFTFWYCTNHCSLLELRGQIHDSWSFSFLWNEKYFFHLKKSQVICCFPFACSRYDGKWGTSAMVLGTWQSDDIQSIIAIWNGKSIKKIRTNCRHRDKHPEMTMRETHTRNSHTHFDNTTSVWEGGLRFCV